MHRFTEPTPTSPAGHDLVEVFVPSWEIECCAPPPTVGEPSSWTLQFVAPSTRYPVEELHRERRWHVVAIGPSTVLVDGALTAHWGEFNGPPPRPGPAVALRGYLSGTVHGPVPDGVPQVTGVVQRIRVASQRFTLVEPRTLEPVAGTLTLAEAGQSPRWFASRLPQGAEDGDTISETGVLLDLAVPAREVRP